MIIAAFGRFWVILWSPKFYASHQKETHSKNLKISVTLEDGPFTKKQFEYVPFQWKMGEFLIFSFTASSANSPCWTFASLAQFHWKMPTPFLPHWSWSSPGETMGASLGFLVALCCWSCWSRTTGPPRPPMNKKTYWMVQNRVLNGWCVAPISGSLRKTSRIGDAHSMLVERNEICFACFKRALTCFCLFVIVIHTPKRNTHTESLPKTAQLQTTIKMVTAFFNWKVLWWWCKLQAGVQLITVSLRGTGYNTHVTCHVSNVPRYGWTVQGRTLSASSVHSPLVSS